MVDALVSTTIEKLGNVLEDEVPLLVGVTNEIEKLSRMFTSIQAVVEDAESRRVKEEAVKVWLQKVKDVAYDVDDILDEWTTEALISQEPDEGDGYCFGKEKVRSFLSPFTCFNHVVLRHKIGSRIKEAQKRLASIAEEMSQLGIRVAGGERERLDTEVLWDEISEHGTSSLVDESSIVGRDNDKNEVLELLLRESSEEVNKGPVVICIVGMGGVGKTTLAQMAYNDERVSSHFDVKMWVCVSDNFSVKRVTKSIIEAATRSHCEPLGLDQLQYRLHEMLYAKRFLLVLDDVWSEDSEKWDRLRIPLQAGALGSRIVVTTRSGRVAAVAGSTHIHYLAVSSEEDCWLLFSHRALGHRSAEERLELEEIGREIVKMCGGSPLAAKMMGSAMRWRRTKREWELVLESEVWKSDDFLGGVLPALLLSYRGLPPVLKQCFTYCCIFPKDRWLEKDRMVKLWVAQGFICSRSGDIEEMGGLYFDDLLSRSLLQDAELDSDGKILRCKMHDLFHDLAQYVAGSDCSIVEIGDQASLNLNNVRHSLFASNEAASIYMAHKLRTLILESGIPQVQHNLFHHLRCLRALDLSKTRIDKLPQTVGQLKLLGYLDLSDTWIKELPAELSNCRRLQTLRLKGCYWLEKLPREMKKMISLRHLELEGTGLRCLPQGIGRLTGIQTLTDFIVGGGDEGCKCGELKQLNHLQGRLRIAGLENVRSKDEAREAELDKKQHLHALSLYSDYTRVELLNDGIQRMEDMLESLQPHTNLKEFKIWYYQGSKLPKWIEDPRFSSLAKVELWKCHRCKQLPRLGKLPSLKYLDIGGMEGVTDVGGEFSGDGINDGSAGGGVSFPKLETLFFFKMPNWKKWELGGGDGEVMPSLVELKIDQCPMLKALPSNLLLIRKLTLNVHDDRMLSGEHLPFFPNLNHLVISNSDDLTSLTCGWLGQLKALRTLEIRECPELRSLPEEFRHLTMLEELQIVNCPHLEKRCRTVNRPLLEKQCQRMDCPCMDCPRSKNSSQDGGEDCDKIAHIPHFRIVPRYHVTVLL
ncbi:putative disease resistance protein RGA1 [Magnolia sinica]|uniref:putative disease resistance protein RGA1 n=1 Tax=Magnolia sinica TaxID=86752 RepID=UPI00265A1DF2|nr:putative disease resistance protein RGA1 [Magnolia sinica]